MPSIMPSIAGVYNSLIGHQPLFFRMPFYAPSQKGPDYANIYAGILLLLLLGKSVLLPTWELAVFLPT